MIGKTGPSQAQIGAHPRDQAVQGILEKYDVSKLTEDNEKDLIQMHHFVRACSPGGLLQLLAAGFDPNLTTQRGSALYACIESAVGWESKSSQETALEKINILIKLGADPSVSSSTGTIADSCTEYAMSFTDTWPELLPTLLKPADPSVISMRGSLLYRATLDGNKDAISSHQAAQSSRGQLAQAMVLQNKLQDFSGPRLPSGASVSTRGRPFHEPR